MPLLYSNINGGRFLCALFFLCLTLAGISSLVSILEIAVHALNDFGRKLVYCLYCVTVNHYYFVVRRVPATVLVVTLNLTIGLGSALDINVLVNQV